MAASTRTNTGPSSKSKIQRKRVASSEAMETAVKKAGPPEVRIFVSYSHKDAAAPEKLQTHLAPWKRDGVTAFVDKNIEPGAHLDPDIARELRRAHIFVAPFSPAYLDSNYCWNIEYKRAMDRRARKLVRVVGVVVKPCGWKQIYAVHRLSLVAEEGEIERREMVEQVVGRTWRAVRNASSVGGLRMLTDLPPLLLRDARLRYRLARRRDRGGPR